MNQNTFHPTATRIEIKFIEMKNLTLTALALIVLATACNEPKPLNYSVKQSLLTKKEYSLSLCGDKNDCIVTYAWYNGDIVYSNYRPLDISDSFIKADRLRAYKIVYKLDKENVK